jgi:hypothetical protein
VLLTGTPTAAATRVEPTLQEAAQSQTTTVTSSPPLHTDPGGEKRCGSVSIELAQANTQ